MDAPTTCGEGLAQRADFPARVSALTAAMAEMLERHQQTLDLTDDNARKELAAYQQLAADFRQLTSQLHATADRMIGYRDLPMARHHEEAMAGPEIRAALTTLVERERVLAAFMHEWFEEDRAMLAAWQETP